jgi:hypothetical protein
MVVVVRTIDDASAAASRGSRWPARRVDRGGNGACAGVGPRWHEGRTRGDLAIYRSDTNRARDTAAPMAMPTGLTPIVYPANDVVPLVASIFADHRGEKVLVVDHSKTVPDIIEAAGGPVLPDICGGVRQPLRADCVPMWPQARDAPESSVRSHLTVACPLKTLSMPGQDVAEHGEGRLLDNDLRGNYDGFPTENLTSALCTGVLI